MDASDSTFDIFSGASWAWESLSRRALDSSCELVVSTSVDNILEKLLKPWYVLRIENCRMDELVPLPPEFAFIYQAKAFLLSDLNFVMQSLLAIA